MLWREDFEEILDLRGIPDFLDFRDGPDLVEREEPRASEARPDPGVQTGSWDSEV